MQLQNVQGNDCMLPIVYHHDIFLLSIDEIYVEMSLFGLYLVRTFTIENLIWKFQCCNTATSVQISDSKSYKNVSRECSKILSVHVSKNVFCVRS